MQAVNWPRPASTRSSNGREMDVSGHPSYSYKTAPKASKETTGIRTGGFARPGRRALACRPKTPRRSDVCSVA